MIRGNAWLPTGFTFSFSASHQVITLRDHAPDIIVRYRAVQNHRIPVFLVLMITRNHRVVGLPPEIAPRRIDLYIDPHASFVFICPQKRLLIPFTPHQHPVGVVKWHVLIHVRKCHAVLQRLFSCRHSLTPVFPVYHFRSRIFNGFSHG